MSRGIDERSRLDCISLGDVKMKIDESRGWMCRLGSYCDVSSAMAHSAFIVRVDM